MSPQLADILVTEKTETYGTVNKTRKDLPVNFGKEKVSKGEIVAYQRGGSEVAEQEKCLP